MMNTVRMGSEHRQQLEKLVRELGERRAAAALEINPVTLARALAGMGVQRTTAAAIRARLLEQPGVSV
jgi:hypothetical protein